MQPRAACSGACDQLGGHTGGRAQRHGIRMFVPACAGVHGGGAGAGLLAGARQLQRQGQRAEVRRARRAAPRRRPAAANAAVCQPRCCRAPPSALHPCRGGPHCRLAATLQRLRRLCEAYSQALLDALAQRAKRLCAAFGLDAERGTGGGGAGRPPRVQPLHQCASMCMLGVPLGGLQLGVGSAPAGWLTPHVPLSSALAVFAESLIRSSVVFQLSKLTNLLLKVRKRPAPGSACLHLRRCPTLEPQACAAPAAADPARAGRRRRGGQLALGCGGGRGGERRPAGGPQPGAWLLGCCTGEGEGGGGGGSPVGSQSLRALGPRHAPNPACAGSYWLRRTPSCSWPRPQGMRRWLRWAATCAASSCGRICPTCPTWVRPRRRPHGFLHAAAVWPGSPSRPRACACRARGAPQACARVRSACRL